MHVIRFTGEESFECFNNLGEVSKERFSRFLHQFLEIGANCVGGVFVLEGSEETGFDGIPADFVDPKSL